MVQATVYDSSETWLCLLYQAFWQLVYHWWHYTQFCVSWEYFLCWKDRTCKNVFLLTLCLIEYIMNLLKSLIKIQCLSSSSVINKRFNWFSHFWNIDWIRLFVFITKNINYNVIFFLNFVVLFDIDCKFNSRIIWLIDKCLVNLFDSLWTFLLWIQMMDVTSSETLINIIFRTYQTLHMMPLCLQHWDEW